MVCPKCGTVNNQNAVTCKRCGQRLRRQAPAPRQQSAQRASANNERKYIIVGTITIVVLIACLIAGAFALNCLCSSCSACADKADSGYINENVEGEWGGEAVPSAGDAAAAPEGA